MYDHYIVPHTVLHPHTPKSIPHPHPTLNRHTITHSYMGDRYTVPHTTVHSHTANTTPHPHPHLNTNTPSNITTPMIHYIIPHTVLRTHKPIFTTTTIPTPIPTLNLKHIHRHIATPTTYYILPHTANHTHHLKCKHPGTPTHLQYIT